MLKRPNRHTLLAAAAALSLLSLPLHAEQRIDLDGTAIFGNKESPNILYVVPWRSAKRLTNMMPPETGRRDELFAPLDRDVFRRQIDWYQTFNENP
ncbi:MAG: hypothetical protein AB2728_12055 [Candidatus Thiodiazotropha sp.]|nr:hypothetical protein [Candidatus Thiodiazotropha taylori]MBT3057266.1 hypothetical protein [Candidatus Thiodiazotropha sp. (ex Lucina pensylvanica)]MBT3061191.1 hypothetical protein [Candidatus Thiodiazotropha sp. (ex Lucina pensylvanica)]MBV2094255.1 hypothetical protein [Candidatus Thiodiazotropha sp. (ex Codakia orbicularis)]PUB77733.1 MAG: hypothetical protein DBO99_10150 [gamma proteobacterium symbiont of Ctena orbiculata]